MSSLLIRNSPINTMPLTDCTAGILQGELDDLTPGRSAVFENPNLKEPQEKPGTRIQTKLLSPVAFRPHLSMGLVLSKTANGCLRLPFGYSLREAKMGHFEVGPLHSFLERSSVFSAELSTDFTFTEAIGWHHIRMLFYSRFSFRRTELLLLSNTARGFTE